MDDIFFTNCPITTDQATVYVGPPSISPTGPIEKCVQYETGVWLTLTTGLTSNIQWYENNNPIAGQNSSTLNLNNNPNNGINWPICTSSITVKNTLTGCTSAPVQVTRKNFSSPQVYLNGGPPYGTPTTYCVSSGGIIKQAPSLNANTTYWWLVYDPNGNPASGVSISPMFTTNPNATISFSGYPYNTATIIAKALDNDCDGASDGSWVQQYTITVNQACRTGNSISKDSLIPPKNTHRKPVTDTLVKKVTIPEKKLIIKNSTKLSLYDTLIIHPLQKEVAPPVNKDISVTKGERLTLFPNPANTQITIIAKDAIKHVEITDIGGNLLTRIKADDSVIFVIDIKTFPVGFYTCKVFTDIGTKYLKFAIQR